MQKFVKYRTNSAFGFTCAASAVMSLLATSPAAMAGEGIMGFRSPSGNIHCMFMDAERGPDAFDAFVRCDIREIDGPLPSRPASCDAEWGRSFNITSQDASGQLICVGDAVFDETHPVLSYGEVWQQSGFTCTSDQTGISCFNAKRHGFTLSRGSRQVF